MTTRFITRRILVPLDGGKLSISALPLLRTIATPDSEVIFLRVVADTAPLINRIPGPHPDAEDVIRRAVDAAETFLADVTTTLPDLGSRVTTAVRVGQAADEILAASEEQDASMILMATHGHGPVGRMVLGSVADRVARSALVPVMLFRPHSITLPLAPDLNVELRRVVVPFDGSGLAREALPVAVAVARSIGGPVHLIRAIAIEDYLDPEADATRTAYGTLIEDAARLETSMYDELEREGDALRAQGVDVTCEVGIGAAAPAIADALQPGDVLVMTSHGEGGVRRWVVGSVAEKLIQQSVAPLVLVPSAGRAAIVSRGN